ncbi:SDR family NAD(P)-dependent oxidoreductase [Neorhizobium galegae]|uniref:SDR family NAD(P)-dependent oxidoreductase n=1 Tax=Neorhizobium galegae TaxID=399 RepID=UPI001F2C0D57|nr:SDR family NAD(P)-dependent oxidoreductase [Neorhizobium galegae]UIK04729.1 SDR family NAD(P)-dependent oxidoreductase [Neorhizobium galegae]
MIASSSRQARAVAITGAGSGLGRDIALGFAARGYIVFGTAVSAAEARELKEASGGRVSLAVCNVTKVDGLLAWVGGVTDALGNSGINILINNATVFAPGPIEVVSLDSIRNVFEVNVFSTLSVINAFLPALRKAHGRIVQISAWSASVPLPFNGPSHASSAAIEVFSAAYRAELRPFGIDVVIASVGNLEQGSTEGSAAALKRATETMTPGERKLYGKRFSTFSAGLESLQATGMARSVAAARIIEIAEQHPAPLRAPIGDDAEAMLRAVREKSDEELDALRLKLGLKLVGLD